MQLFVASSLVFLFACAADGSPTGIEPIECPPESTLTYTNFGADAIQSHCLSCHGATDPVLLTQDQVQKNAAAILDAAVYTDAMPRRENMQLIEREQLGEWLACGAP